MVFISKKYRISSIDQSSSFSTEKDSMQLRSVRSWTSVYNDDAPSYLTVTRCPAQFKHPQSAFEVSLRTGPTSIITTDQNIEAVEQMVMRDQQISVRRMAYKLAIPTTTVYEIISNHLGMKKVSTKWVQKLLIPIQHANRLDCYQEQSKFGQLFSSYCNWR